MNMYLMEIVVTACLLGTSGAQCDTLTAQKRYTAEEAGIARIACLQDNRVVANVWASTRPDHVIKEYSCTIESVVPVPRERPE